MRYFSKLFLRKTLRTLRCLATELGKGGGAKRGGLATEMAGGGAIAGLAAGADADEAAFADEAFEEGADAVGCEGPVEGEADILVGHGVVGGKEGGEALLDVILFCVESLAIRDLADLESLDFGQQLAVGLEVDACDMDITTVVVAVLHLDLAFEGEAEGADAGQVDGVALLQFVEHDALKIAQRVC